MIPHLWCAAQESSFKAASSAEKKGRVDTAARQAEEVWDKSSTKELLETVKAPTEGRIAEQGQIMIILAARKDGHRTFHFWRFGKTKNVSFSIDRSERRSTKLTAGETAERQNCFSHLTAGKTAHHFFWQPERRQIKDVSQTA